MKAFVDYSHVDMLRNYNNAGGHNTSTREMRRLEQRTLAKNLDAQIKAGKIPSAMRPDLAKWIKTDSDAIWKYLGELTRKGKAL